MPAAKAGKKAGSNAPTGFDLRGELYRISGTDLTQIDGINIMNAQTIIAEVGTMKRNIENTKSAASRKKRKTLDWRSLLLPLSQHKRSF